MGVSYILLPIGEKVPDRADEGALTLYIYWPDFELLIRSKPSIESCDDRLANAVQVVNDLGVPESEDAVPAREQASIATIVGFTLGMLASIEFDQQLGLAAGEISKIRSNGTLSDELVAAQSSVAEPVP